MRRLLEKYYRIISRFILRRRLKNKNFTILTDTCIGGVIYHELGLQFLSPTINLWMHDKDFYKFVNNLGYYLALPLKFVEGIENYPTAYLGDILIHFNHYKTNEEAEAKWEERKKRINYDNLFIIASDRPLNSNPVTYEDMKSLEKIKCRGKIVFSTRMYPDVPYIIHLPKDKEGDFVNTYMLDKTNILHRWKWEKVFDYVSWLNNGN